MRRLPVGAEVVSGGVHFRVWAPDRQRIDVTTGGRAVPLSREEAGYFSGLVEGATAGARYLYRIDGSDERPDPASRFQPEGPHRASEVIDPDPFQWTDVRWRGVQPEGQVIYEMHVGTFTPEGNWASAGDKLQFLADTGITVIEVMPVAEFPGQFGWGYDGVHPFAPTRLYGAPDDFRRFVDRAHAIGVGVILDVVYNHLGPDGNYFGEFSKHYFTDQYETDWGAAINFSCSGVRDFFVSNAAYWIDEFHLDGLRLDATQNIYDESHDHILAAIARAARAAAKDRPIILVAENEPQESRLVRPQADGGYGLDMLWNDDFHHSAMVAMTGHNEAYYTDYLGTPQEFISAIKYGSLYQGQWYKWQEKPRGTPTFGVPPAAFVTFTQNHDQVANLPNSQRCHMLSNPGTYRALTTLTLLGPGTPMLFQGQEFLASSPFYFFADHAGELGEIVRRGRGEFMAQFGRSEAVPDPGARETFERCKLDWTELEAHRRMYDFHRDLLRLRKTFDLRRIDGATLGPLTFVVRFFGKDRLLVVNLGRDLELEAIPEPLLAPPAGRSWALLWSSEDPKYGGAGWLPEIDGPWRLQGRSAFVLKPKGGADE